MKRKQIYKRILAGILSAVILVSADVYPAASMAAGTGLSEEETVISETGEEENSAIVNSEAGDVTSDVSQGETVASEEESEETEETGETEKVEETVQDVSEAEEPEVLENENDIPKEQESIEAELPEEESSEAEAEVSIGTGSETLEDATSVDSEETAEVDEEAEEQGTAETEETMETGTAVYDYVVSSGTCGENLTWELTSDGVLTISGTGEMDDWGNSIDTPWYDDHLKIKEIIVKAGVISIGNRAFYSCKNLEKIEIPESLINIGAYAFYHCDGLTGIVIPDSVTSIENHAFDACINMTSVILPDSITEIEIGTFSSCSSLKSISIPENVTTIGSSSFSYCYDLIDVNFSESGKLKKIGGSAFYLCINLEQLDLPEGLTEVDYYAFQECSEIQKVVFPKSIKSIGLRAFQGCHSLNAIYFKGDHPEILKFVFSGVTATAYYPIGNSTWTEDVRQDYDGTITWVEWDPETGVTLPGGDAEVPDEEPTVVVGDNTEEEETKFKFGTDVEINFPDDFPVGFLAGDTMEMDFSWFPMQFECDGNEFKFGIGTSNLADMEKDDWFNFKKFVEKKDKKYFDSVKKYLSLDSGQFRVGQKGETEATLYGYVEGVLGEDGQILSAGGNAVIEMKVKVSNQWQMIILSVPIVLKTSMEAGIETTISLGFDFESSTVYFGNELEVTLPGIKVSLGVGVAYFCDISVYGGFDNIVKIGFDTSNGLKTETTAKLKGEFGISYSLLFFKDKKVLFDNDEGWVYYERTEPETEQYSVNSAFYKSSLGTKETNWQIIRSENTSAWNGQTGRSGISAFSLSDDISSDTIYTLQSDIYENANPVLLSTENGSQVLIHTADIESRSTGNHTAVCYSVYDAGTCTWSEPQILDDDGTADFDPSVSVKGDEIYVAWVNAKRSFSNMETEAEDFMKTLLSACEIRVAKLDIQDKSIDVYDVTDNSTADLRPAIAVVNDKISVAWYENTGNDIVAGNSENILHLAQMEGNQFELKTEQILRRNITGTAVGELDGDCVAAFALSDETFNPDTFLEDTPRTTLLLMDEKGNANEIYDGSVQANPTFVTTGTENRLIWYALEDGESSLRYSQSLSDTPQVWLGAEAALSQDYTLIDGENTQLLVTAADDADPNVAGRDLYAYVIEDDRLSESVVLTEVEGYTGHPSGIWDGEKYVFLFTRTDATIGETLETTTDLCITGVTPQSSVAIDDTIYDAQELMPGAAADVTVEVVNNGLDISDTTTVQILYGTTVIGETILTTALEPGASAEAVVSVIMPSDAPENASLTVQAISNNGNHPDTEVVSIAGASGDLSLAVSEEGDTITATITNSSGFKTDAALNISTIVTDNDARGQFSTVMFSLAPYETTTYEISKTEWNTTEQGIVTLSVKSNSSDAFLSDNEASVYVGENGFKNLSHLVASKKTVTYAIGDTLSLDDLEVKIVYEDGSEAVVTDYTTNIDEIDMLTAGEKALTITYTEGFQTRMVEFPITVSDDSVMKGDVNMDGQVGLQDLMMCLYHISGRSVLTGDALKAADVNSDGSVTVVDLMRLLYYVSGRNAEL